jgi:hypothetical protein
MPGAAVVRDLAPTFLPWPPTTPGTSYLQTPTVMTKKIRRRIYNVTGRLVRTGRRLVLRLPRRWPWAGLITAALERLRALPAASG